MFPLRTEIANTASAGSGSYSTMTAVQSTLSNKCLLLKENKLAQANSNNYV
jgi:hypothetical protein